MEDLSALGVCPIFKAYLPLEAEAVAEIERRLGRSIPDDLLRFTQRWGCAAFVDCVIVECALSLPLAYLFGGGDSTYSMRWNLETYGDRLPSALVPFSGDEWGNVFCYSMDPSQGSIFWWNHEEGLHARNPALCLPTLGAFIGALRLG